MLFDHTHPPLLRLDINMGRLASTTYALAFSNVGTAMNLCIAPACTAMFEVQEKIEPKAKVQNEVLMKGFGSILKYVSNICS